jgi:hypothetical protein
LVRESRKMKSELKIDRKQRRLRASRKKTTRRKKKR